MLSLPVYPGRYARQGLWPPTTNQSFGVFEGTYQLSHFEVFRFDCLVSKNALRDPEEDIVRGMRRCNQGSCPVRSFSTAGIDAEHASPRIMVVFTDTIGLRGRPWLGQ